MSELTLLVLRLGFLGLLWVFIFIIVYALRSDLFGTSITKVSAPSTKNANRPEPAMSEPRPTPRASSDAPTTVTQRAKPSASVPSSQGSSNIMQPTATPNRIVVTQGPKAGMEVPLPSSGLTIGRSSSTDFVIRDDYTSGEHAKLSQENGHWTLRDLNSTNGTKVDGKKITGSVVVGVGSTVTIGTTSFELRR
ncbi:FHA domain-containing protein FhaB/FipA [Humidisolicoccus flavus]|uniref:FHA domain-containing protein FhaB/FipA n=1 Tax=Humidisolicoccus flavus TaxID=3111414 RepID=UPI0032516E12